MCNLQWVSKQQPERSELQQVSFIGLSLGLTFLGKASADKNILFRPLPKLPKTILSACQNQVPMMIMVTQHIPDDMPKSYVPFGYHQSQEDID